MDLTRLVMAAELPRLLQIGAAVASRIRFSLIARACADDQAFDASAILATTLDTRTKFLVRAFTQAATSSWSAHSQPSSEVHECPLF